MSIVSVGDLTPTQNNENYIANLIVLIEGQSELLPVKVIVPSDKVMNITEGAVLDITPTSRATFSVRRYQSQNGTAQSVASKIDEILKGVKK